MRPGGREAPTGARPTPPGPRAHSGGGPRLPRVGLSRCDAARRLAAAREQITRAVGPGRWGPHGSRGGLPWETRALFPANSFEIAWARGDFASLFQRGRLWYARLTRPHRQCPGAGLVRLPANDTFAVGTAPRRRGGGGFLALPNNDDKPPRQAESLLPESPSHPVLPPAHTFKPTLRVPRLAAQLQERGGAKPPARGASVCSGSDDFRAVFWQANPISVCSVRI